MEHLAYAERNYNSIFFQFLSVYNDDLVVQSDELCNEMDHYSSVFVDLPESFMNISVPKKDKHIQIKEMTVTGLGSASSRSRAFDKICRVQLTPIEGRY